jgi:hypothetical protein
VDVARARGQSASTKTLPPTPKLDVVATPDPPYRPDWDFGGFTAWDSYRHIGDLRVAQVGFANNAGLVLAVAFLGFIGNRLASIAATPEPDWAAVMLLRTALVLGCVSVCAGALLAVNRMTDFRKSQHVARRRWSIHRLKVGGPVLTLDRGKTIPELEALNEEARKVVKRHESITYWLLFGQLGLCSASSSSSRERPGRSSAPLFRGKPVR